MRTELAVLQIADYGLRIASLYFSFRLLDSDF